MCHKVPESARKVHKVPMIFPCDCTFAWYYNNSHGRTHPVGTKSPNELGLYDMAGMEKAMLSGSGWQYSHGSNKIGTTDTVCFPKSTPDHMLCIV